jgi:hypothetical protein
MVDSQPIRKMVETFTILPPPPAVNSNLSLPFLFVSIHKIGFIYGLQKVGPNKQKVLETLQCF